MFPGLPSSSPCLSPAHIHGKFHLPFIFIAITKENDTKNTSSLRSIISISLVYTHARRADPKMMSFISHKTERVTFFLKWVFFFFLMILRHSARDTFSNVLVIISSKIWSKKIEGISKYSYFYLVWNGHGEGQLGLESSPGDKLVL